MLLGVEAKLCRWVLYKLVVHSRIFPFINLLFDLTQIFQVLLSRITPEHSSFLFRSLYLTIQATTKYSEEHSFGCICTCFFTDKLLHYNIFTCKRKLISKKILTKSYYKLTKLNVAKNLLLTAIHSLRSSPSGSITACLRFPLPRVASACFKSSY